MKSTEEKTAVLENVTVNVKVKLSLLWVALVLIYLYVDIFALYKPGVVQGILDGKIWRLDITQEWALLSLILMMIPCLMVFLSLVLGAKANRWANIVVAAIYVVVGIATTIGETWVSYIVGHAIGIGLLALVIGYASKWPRTNGIRHSA